ncbi:3-keto-disaccharide hydrolase [Larkinella sp. VNQ87]|uniref:3-keto-disaccharide hydrolase n=1 Tax=Larkinella sp. VNQ87 TaxID=3400921 RepID=UPI003C120C82
MKNLLIVGCLAVLLGACSKSSSPKSSSKAGKDGWISLFDGKSLDGWKVGKNAESFKIEDGAIAVNGQVAHLFYDGPVQNHDFKNFQFKAKVMTLPGSNSGMYFHTQYQEASWPRKGFEVQVNNSHTDWRRTASLYAIQDVKETYVKDNEWYTEEIMVQGKKVTIKINDKVVNEYTEPDNVERSKDMAERKISSGTFALQAHDPKSKVYFKDIMVKVLPD